MPVQSVCFESCDCACGTIDPEFDRVVSTELKQLFKLDEICRAGIAWYLDRTQCEADFKGWPDGNGLYVLWHKDDYCSCHEMFHMHALYVGKGRFRPRLMALWRTKPTADEMLIYVTQMQMSNRMAKYVEQLLLDIYKFPLNKAENQGSRRLCAHFTQFEVD